jgi:hypothetical protein
LSRASDQPDKQQRNSVHINQRHLEQLELVRRKPGLAEQRKRPDTKRDRQQWPGRDKRPEQVALQRGKVRITLEDFLDFKSDAGHGSVIRNT